MARQASEPTLPACYALVQPGLETIAAEEITTDLGGRVKKSGRGYIVFRVPELTPDLLKLRTTEDVFLLAWGTDELTHRAEDLKSIRAWTANEPDWAELLKIHHLIHPKPKGKPTYRLVAQMQGSFVYRRVDALAAMAKGLQGKLPASWKPAEENAAVEVWLSIVGPVALCGVRLSDRSMRHRTYKSEHVAASLRPTVAAAMVRLAEAEGGQVVLDPMCGAGTILAEQLERSKQCRAGRIELWGGDKDRNALVAAVGNLRKLGPAHFCRWDTTRLPLANTSVDRIICNPPFGKQLASFEELRPLYTQAAREWNRVLKPGGRAVVIVAEGDIFRDAVRTCGWKALRKLRVRLLGQQAQISVWRKPMTGDKLEAESIDWE